MFKEVLALPDHLKKRFEFEEEFVIRLLDDYFGLWEVLPDPRYFAVLLNERVLASEESKRLDLAMFANRLLVSVHHLASLAPQVVEDSGRKLLRARLEELEAFQLAKDLQKEVIDVRTLVDKATQNLATIAATEGNRFEGPLSKGIELENTHFKPTNISFVDEFCDGGLAAGEVVGHSAPIGQGKTTLCLQVMWAKVEQVIAPYLHLPLEEIPFDKIPRVYGFFYERVVNLMPNFISNAAEIPREVMGRYFKDQDVGWFSSSERKDYKDYEVARYKEQLADAAAGRSPWPPGEKERFERKAYIADKLCQFADFSGSRAVLADWAGMGVEGVRRYVDSHQQKLHGPGVAIAVVDYVGAMVDLWMSNSSKDVSSKSRNDLIRTVVTGLTVNVAGVFKCPVWAAHQLNSAENKRGGGEAPDPSANEGTGMFLERCAVGFASGATNSDGLAIFVHAKQRRHMRCPPKVCRLGSDFARWIPADKNFEIVSGRVVSKDEHNSRGEGTVGRNTIRAQAAFEEVNFYGSNKPEAL